MDCDCQYSWGLWLALWWVVTLVHFYCGLRQYLRWHLFAERARSNPCPFLLWIATWLSGPCKSHWSIGSNPCPFLLWIATYNFPQQLHQLFFMVVTLVHFYCGLRLFILFFSDLFVSLCSNPCPFLLWIATRLHHTGIACAIVVTLVHFYCGLRL